MYLGSYWHSKVAASLEYAVSTSRDDSFFVFLVGVLFHLLDKLEEDRFLGLIGSIEPFLRKSIQKAVLLKGKSNLLEVITYFMLTFYE